MLLGTYHLPTSDNISIGENTAKIPELSVNIMAFFSNIKYININ